MKHIIKKIVLLAAIILTSIVPNLAAAQVTSANRGGTGTSTIPTYGKVLVGNSKGSYSVVATSTLGLPTFASLASYILTSAFPALFDARLSATTTLPQLTRIGTTTVLQSGTFYAVNVKNVPGSGLTISTANNDVSNISRDINIIPGMSASGDGSVNISTQSLGDDAHINITDTSGGGVNISSINSGGVSISASGTSHNITFPSVSDGCLSLLSTVLTSSGSPCPTAGAAYPFTPTTNFGTTNSATNTPIWARAGINASTTSSFDNASTTQLSSNLLYLNGSTNAPVAYVGDSNYLIFYGSASRNGSIRYQLNHDAQGGEFQFVAPHNIAIVAGNDQIFDGHVQMNYAGASYTPWTMHDNGYADREIIDMSISGGTNYQAGDTIAIQGGTSNGCTVTLGGGQIGGGGAIQNFSGGNAYHKLTGCGGNGTAGAGGYSTGATTASNGHGGTPATVTITTVATSRPSNKLDFDSHINAGGESQINFSVSEHADGNASTGIGTFTWGCFDGGSAPTGASWGSEVQATSYGTPCLTLTSSSTLTAGQFLSSSTLPSVITNASTTNLSATTFCLIGDTCRTAWPTGTVSSIATNNGLTGGTITTTGTVGLNITALSTNGLVAWNGSNLAATGTPSLTVGYLIATSTSVASSLPYASSTAITVGTTIFAPATVSGSKSIIFQNSGNSYISTGNSEIDMWDSASQNCGFTVAFDHDAIRGGCDLQSTGHYSAGGGSAGNNSYQLQAATGYGMYFPSSTSVGFSVNGVEIGRFTSTGFGVGTSTPGTSIDAKNGIIDESGAPDFGTAGNTAIVCYLSGGRLGHISISSLLLSGSCVAN